MTSSEDQADGRYTELADGRSAIVFEREYRHPIDRVWHVVTDPDELGHWFPSAVTFELRAGGTVTFTGDPNLADDTGTVLAVEPPHRLHFEWGGDELHFDLCESADGGTHFVLTNVLQERNTAARNAWGWDVCLTSLAHRLDGIPDAGPHADPHWEVYDRYLAARLPSGAEIPERD